MLKIKTKKMIFKKRNKKKFAVILFSSSLLLATIVSDIHAQSRPYRPGETLSPGCDPGDSNCKVDTSFLKICKGTANNPAGGSDPDRCPLCTEDWKSSFVYNGGSEGDNKTYFCDGSKWNIASLWLQSGSNAYYGNGIGNVGIGTSTPAKKLDVNGDTRIKGKVIMGNNNTASGHYSVAMGDTTTASGDQSTAMGHKNTASGSFSLATGRETVAEGYASVTMGFGTTATGDSGSVAMGYRATATGDYGSVAMGFGTTADGGQSIAIGTNITVMGRNSVGIGLHRDTDTPAVIEPANVMAIMGGNVGIGTTSPTAQLDVESNFDNKAITAFNDSHGLTISNDARTDGSYSMLKLKFHDDDAWYMRAINNGNDDGDLEIGSSYSSYPGNNAKLKILSNGNVGIGTTSPTSKLHVTGDIKVSGTVDGVDLSTKAATWDIDNSITNETPLSGTGITVSGRTVGIDTTIPISWLGIHTFNDSINLANGIWRSDGNVGIGTTTPVSPLEVSGIIHSTVGGIKLPDGTIIDSASDLGKWQTSDNHNSISYNIGRVGIGTGASGTPPSRLTVASDINNSAISAHNDTSGLTVTNYDNTSGSYSILKMRFNETDDWYMRAILRNNDDGDLEIGTAYSSYPGFNNAKLTILSNGNVGIGTTSPSEQLEVAGAIKTNRLCIGDDCKTSWDNLIIGEPVDGALCVWNASLGGISCNAKHVVYDDLITLPDGRNVLTLPESYIDNSASLVGDVHTVFDCKNAGGTPIWGVSSNGPFCSFTEEQSGQNWTQGQTYTCSTGTNGNPNYHLSCKKVITSTNGGCPNGWTSLNYRTFSDGGSGQTCNHGFQRGTQGGASLRDIGNWTFQCVGSGNWTTGTELVRLRGCNETWYAATCNIAKISCY